MTTYRLTPAAQRDLSDIWDYTEEHWDARQAETYTGELRAAIERVAEQPERGSPCDDVRINYRRYPVGSHLIFYIETELGINVVRVLHQRMDPTRHF